VGAHAAFDCTSYAATCSDTTGYEAYTDCDNTAAANDMTCRESKLASAVQGNGAAVNCALAAPTSTKCSAIEPFDCTLYASTCSGVTDYEAYKMCDSTVAVNDAQHMACRINHLRLAAVSGGSKEHCPHAAPTAGAPCNTEMLKTFDCDLYVSTCSSVSDYSAYSNCAGTVAANSANSMACRIQHLQLAAVSGGAATHCKHAAPAAAAPCDTENITLALALEVAPTTENKTDNTTAASTTAASTGTVSSAIMQVSSGLGLVAALSVIFA